MSDNKKNISVCFAKYEPYEHIPDICHVLGKISDDDLKKIMDTFSDKNAQPHSCILHMSLDFHDQAVFGHPPWDHKRHRVLELSNMFHYNTKCNKHGPELDETAKIKRCARNLQNGKCVDEFIRNTLGAILYPQHYAMEKQK